MKTENSTWEFCLKTTFPKNELKLYENWKFNLRILLKDNFTEIQLNQIKAETLQLNHETNQI